MLTTNLNLTQALRIAYKKGQKPIALVNVDTLWARNADSFNENRWHEAMIYPQEHYPDWAKGFAWLGVSHNILSVDWPKMNLRTWSVLDISQMAVLTQQPWEYFSDIISQYDKPNRWSLDKSEVAQWILGRINEVIRSYHYEIQIGEHSMVIMNSLSSAKESDRFIVTKLYIDTLRKLQKELDNKATTQFFDNYQPSDDFVIKKVGMDEFLSRILQSKKLWLCEKQPSTQKWLLAPSKLEKERYAGARLDRLGERNRLTNAIGMLHVSGNVFWSLNDVSNATGNYLADVVRNYGIDGFTVVDDNVILDLQHDITVPAGNCGYSTLYPSTKQSYAKLKNYLNKHLKSSEAYIDHQRSL